MPATQSGDTDALLRRAAEGDPAARDRLFARHQGRLRQLVAWRLDRRVAARVDPSDVVQEALADAAAKFPGYLRSRPLPFYPWLRQLALERLIALHRRHVLAGKRTVTREEPPPPLNDESAPALAHRLLAAGVCPVGDLLREEVRARVRDALGRLDLRDREVLVLRHLEQLSVRDMAAVLGVSEGAVKTRHVRALQRFRALLEAESGEAS